MTRRAGVLIAWLAGTLVSVMIASAAVGAVRGRVTDTSPAIDLATTTAAPAASSEPTSTSSNAASTTSTTRPEVVGTSTPPTTDVTTTTLQTSTTTPTSAPTGQSQIKTYRLVGGTVTIQVWPDHIMLLGAQPKSGFTVDDKESSSRRIEIEFTSSRHESKLHAELRDGKLDVNQEESGEDDGDHD